MNKFEFGMMFSVVDVLPMELFANIVNDWLDDSPKDLCSFDIALANKELRFLYYSYLEKVKTGLQKTFSIKIDSHWTEILRWKDRRGIPVTKLRLQFTSNFYNSLISHYFPHLQELTIKKETFPLACIFYAHLPKLRKLHLSCGGLIVPTALHVSPMNLIDFSMDDLSTILCRKTNRQDVPILPQDCSEIYAWIAACCPALQTFRLLNCYGADYHSVLRMIGQLPALQSFSFVNKRLSSLISTETPESLSPVVLSPPSLDYSNLLSSPKLREMSLVDTKYPIHLIDMLTGGCQPDKLQQLVLFVDGLTPVYQTLLLTTIARMCELRTVSLEAFRMDVNPIVLALSKHCIALEEIILYAIQLQDDTCRYLGGNNNGWKKAHFKKVTISDQGMRLLCQENHTFVSSIVSLAFIRSPLLTSRAYIQLLTTPFPQLQSLSLVIEEVESVAGLWNILNTCFSSPLTKQLKELRLEISQQQVQSQGQEEEELVLATGMTSAQHITKYWHCVFPNLQKLVLLCPITSNAMQSLVLQRILQHGTALNSLELQLTSSSSLYESPSSSSPRICIQGKEAIREYRQSLSLLS